MSIRVGLVGIGNMGKNHLRVLSMMKGVSLEGACDANAAMKPLAERYGARFFTSLDEMLEQKELDAVDLVVPTVLHEPLALKCIKKGKHVFVEKPISDTIGSALKMADAAKSAGKVLMVGHIERFNPAVNALKKAVENENVFSLSFMRVGPAPPRKPDVGVILDVGIHDFDLFQFLTGENATEVFCVAQAAGGIDNSAQMLLKGSNGVSAQFTLNWNTPFKVRRIEVVARDRVLHADLISNDVKSYFGFSAQNNPTFTTEHVPVGYTEPLAAELAHFMDKVSRNDAEQDSARSAINALAIACAALESAATGGLAKVNAAYP
jgi:predicted dehydrogenase